MQWCRQHVVRGHGGRNFNENNMTTKQVIHALHLHQKWRRGAISEMPLTAREYGEALDEAIRLLRQYNKQQDGAVR